jgi:hypothetical protein
MRRPFLPLLTSFLTVAALVLPAAAREINASNAAEIRTAMAEAKPGDIISIPPGEYEIPDALVAKASGTKEQPITLRTKGDTGYAKLKITGKSDIGFRVLGKFWILHGLHIEGNPATVDLIQIDATQGGGDLRMTDCKISKCQEFLIKASRSREVAADNVILDHCEWFDCGGTAIDLVAGDRWIIRGNYVHDYGKDGGTHYGIFLKGGGRFGLIESNIVEGRAGKGTVGISFGGGLTGPQWLPLAADGKVAPEHTEGVCRNNIVIGTGDCAFHANNASKCEFYNNLAYDCGAGFQRQGSYPPDPRLINNVLSGSIRGGESSPNLTKVNKAWFTAPDAQDFRLTADGRSAFGGKGLLLKENPMDFFGQPRPGNDLGPLNPNAAQSTRWQDRRMAAASQTVVTPPAAPQAAVPTPAVAPATPAAPATVSVPELLEKVRNAPANTWIEIPKSALLAVAPKNGEFPKTWAVSGPVSVVAAWGGAAFDTKRERLIAWGGGHSDYYGNELYAFDIRKLAWERLNDPFPEPVKDQEVNADGSPHSRHTYGGLAYLAHADRFFGLGGSLGGVGYAKCDRTWTYDFDAKKWEDRQPAGQLPGGGFCQGCAYDPASQRLYFGSNERGLFAYDYEKNTWAKLDDKTVEAQGFAVDTKRKLLFGVGRKRMAVYDIGGGNFKQQLIQAPGGDEIVNAHNAAGFAYDPVADRLVGWASWAPGKVFAFDPDAKTWEARETEGGPKLSKTATNGTFGRWQYVPSLNAFIAVSDAGANVFFYKYTAGPGAKAK